MTKTDDSKSAHGTTGLPERELRVLAVVTDTLKQHHRRIGTTERLEKSVAEIIAGAITQADHKAVAASLTPLVVNCIRQEIRNSRQDIIESLYPMVGRLISAYAAHASRELIYQADRRLEGILTGRFARLRLKSWVQGIPYRELALREAQGLRATDLLLIRRGTGELIEQWHAEPDRPLGADRGNLFSAMLSAITEFADQAMSADQGGLRELDLGSSRVFLRTTPGFIFAVRCLGKGGREIEKRLDRALLSFMQANTAALQNQPAGRGQPADLLPELARMLNDELAPRPGEYGARERGPVFAVGVAALAILIGLGSVGNYAWQRAEAAEVEQIVRDVVSRQNTLSGFPIDIDVPIGANRVVLSGTAPTTQAVEQLVSVLGQTLGSVEIVTNIVLDPVFAVLSQTRQTVARLARHLLGAQQTLSEPVIAQLQDVLRATVSQPMLRQAGAQLSATVGVLNDLSGDLTKLGENLKQVRETLGPRAGTQVAGAVTSNLRELQDRLLLVERLSADATSLVPGILSQAGELDVERPLLRGDLEAISALRREVRLLSTSLLETIAAAGPSVKQESAGLPGELRGLLVPRLSLDTPPQEFVGLDESGIDWRNVELPRTNFLENWRPAMLSTRRRDAPGALVDGTKISITPLLIMPGLGRVDLSGFADGMADRPLTGAVTGTISSTPELVGSTLSATGEIAGGVTSETLGAAGEIVGTTKDALGATTSGVLDLLRREPK